jgi:hypothetical protein
VGILKAAAAGGVGGPQPQECNYFRTKNFQLRYVCYGQCMTSNVLSLARRHVLGDLYSRCDQIEGDIPVYLDDEVAPIVIGYADQSLGHYADAFSFHLEPDDCKKLSSGQFSFSVDYELSSSREAGQRGRVKLTSITLTGRKSYEKPAPKSLVTTDTL